MESYKFQRLLHNYQDGEYNHIETQVKRFDSTAVTTVDVKYTKTPQKFSNAQIKNEDGLTSLLYQG